jgi:ADP-ribosyl-[dinitrogen reductase] hydrolase
MDSASNLLSRAVGCMVGAAVGDALGALLEWELGPVHDSKIQWALGLPPGGPHHLASGQITDDTEQHLCLAKGLVEGKGFFNLDKIAREYSRWRWGGQPGNTRVQPFDVGKASGNAFGSCSSFEPCYFFPECRNGDQCYFSHRVIQEDNVPWAKTMLDAAATHNAQTKSNGSLMRSMPLAVWCHKLNPSQIATCVKMDSSLSHPNSSCVDATCAYIIACAHIIRTNNRKEAVQIASQWVSANACQDVQTWMNEALLTDNFIPFRCDVLDDGSPTTDGAIAFIRWAFANAFRKLKNWSGVDVLNENMWIESIKEIMIGGGDTDTNAAICGGILGASGIELIPKGLIEKVLGCKTENNLADPGFGRPDFLSAKHLTNYAQELVKLAPSSQEFDQRLSTMNK